MIIVLRIIDNLKEFQNGTVRRKGRVEDRDVTGRMKLKNRWKQGTCTQTCTIINTKKTLITRIARKHSTSDQPQRKKNTDYK